jgi:hypothetical protein
MGRRAERSAPAKAGGWGEGPCDSPADGLQLFVTELMKAGISKDQITAARRETAGKLLMG